MQRLPNWRARLAAELDRQRREPFAWSAHDCAVGLACGVVEAITGQDLRPSGLQYSGPSGALRVMQSLGASSLGDLAALHLPEVHPVFARVGDLGLLPDDGPLGGAFCVVDASGLIVLTTEGHGRRPREDMARAFKVG